MDFAQLANFQMLAVFVLIGITLFLYASDKLPLEVTSFSMICALLLLFYFFPVFDNDGNNLLSPQLLLAGFANPALLTVMALLVLGEGLSRTGALDQVAVIVHKLSKGRAIISVALSLFVVAVISAFLNNIPVVVIFVPIMQALANKLDKPASRYMMPLSFAAILGGMTTLIGSSTNLLVSSALIKLGEKGFDFFTFTIPGLVMAAVGLIYVIFIAPKILPDRRGYDVENIGGGKQFQAQIKINDASELDGMKPISGFFPNLKDITLLTIERAGSSLYPPYDSPLQSGDILVVAATRDVIANFMASDPELLHPDISHKNNKTAIGLENTDIESEQRWLRGEQTIAEAMVKPDSPMIGKSLSKIGFHYHNHCMVIGIERRIGMRRELVTETKLRSGDILLIQGGRNDLETLRSSKDVILMEWSAEELANPYHAKRAVAIFAAVIIAAGSGFIPTEVAALSGAALMILTGAINMDAAINALDRQIILLIAAALALGLAMERTGGAEFLSQGLLFVMGDSSPAVILSAFFLLVAFLANILSTKATAVLFTPIAVSIAHHVNMPVEPFAVAVVFAANCSFASPVGYQTNLLVMAPGHYKFIDFVKIGFPLIIICWITFSLFVPWWYGF